VRRVLVVLVLQVQLAVLLLSTLVVAVEVKLLALVRLVVLVAVAVAVQHLREPLELPTLEVVEAAGQLHLTAALAVAVSSFFATQTHLEPHQLLHKTLPIPTQ
jgi:hypothetical protein